MYIENHQFSYYDYFTLGNVIDFFMVFGPSLGFFIQIMKIQQEKTSEGFSKLLVLILLIANILRIFFWIGKHFTIVLLLQSILMVLTQFYLLYVCLKYSHHTQEKINEEKINEKYNDEFTDVPITNSTDIRRLFSENNSLREIVEFLYNYKPSRLLNPKNFWDWPYFFDFAFFIFLFSLVVDIFSRIIFGYSNHSYIEFLGGLSAGVEALIGVPQAYSNLLNQDTGALSIWMILTWVFGDTFKTYYYISNKAPIQLVFCGFFQLFIDVVIIFQIFYYSGMLGAVFPYFNNEELKKRHDSIIDFSIEYKDEKEDEKFNSNFNLNKDKDKKKENLDTVVAVNPFDDLSNLKDFREVNIMNDVNTVSEMNIEEDSSLKEELRKKEKEKLKEKIKQKQLEKQKNIQNMFGAPKEKESVKANELIDLNSN